MKKMKGVVGMETSPAYVNPKTRFKHQSLLQDYEELEKETEVKKKRLLMMKHKRLTLQAEVRFLKRRYKYLIENQSSISQTVKVSAQVQNYEIQTAKVSKVKNYPKKGSGFRLSIPALDLNQRERTSIGGEGSFQWSAPVLDLNQKMKVLRGKEATLQIHKPNFDLNQQDKIILNVKEATKRKNPPAFDLNQIAREEEEFQANCEPLRREEQKKSLPRGGCNDDQHNDNIQLQVCRNIRNGSNQSGNRKISWQDKVAVRV